MKRQESKQEEDVEYDFAKRPRRASAAVEMSGKPASPFPSCVSMKSDASMDWQDKFCQGQTSTREKPGKPASPVPSCASMKSEASMDWQDKFCQGQTSTGKSTETGRPQSPTPTYISMKSNNSLDPLENFKQGEKKSEEGWPTSVTAAQGYTLPDPTGHQKEGFCPEHDMPMKVLCKTDKTLICKQCATLTHRGHKKSYTIRARVKDQLLGFNFESVLV